MGELIEDLFAVGIVLALVAQEVDEHDLAAVADATVGDAALFEEFDEIGARDVEQVGRLLSRQLCVNRRDRKSVV